ncbi:pimeloyl-ACP methyl ester carboxylesterase [Glaciihabitans tibetensis]|uniref:Pimeloyl-ACP methyl ester carboxylesterase n=1 Tax=Glaciihabitans tibetensis TaxID=1266600 RepID=A0A2T0V6U0_9MICO|nr:alpha/beta hydrolase [Glaciihabitans tibetensis]PRY65864.1 pimeloyl-ACP methyl ester carboxylesterase [Glaciihabitans tibetensis]
MPISEVEFVDTPLLRVGYEVLGEPTGQTVVLLHGFPYDVRSYDDVAPRLAKAGVRVVAPYVRGYGPTRFLSDQTLRSGQQAALGQDLIDLLDALDVEHAIVAGYDWGGRAACVAAALFPERIDGLVTVSGYPIQDIAGSVEPDSPLDEKMAWYQYYFHAERGRRGLERNREDLCRVLWRDWSPDWVEAETAFAASAPSLHNPDFVQVVVHSYRHRFGLAEGDQRYDDLERRLAQRPVISVPTVSVDSGADGFGWFDSSEHASHFSGSFQRVVLPGVGHNPPQEAPLAFSDAILELVH